jgi:hypothetical protein
LLLIGICVYIFSVYIYICFSIHIYIYSLYILYI